jgi:CheY-like chemotaxis protein
MESAKQCIKPLTRLLKQLEDKVMPTDLEKIFPGYQQDRPEQSLLQGKRIVICEDEGLTLMQLRRMMTQAGLTVVGAVNNGREGVDVTLRERPDIVLMDVGMPVMDGFEAARSILAEYRPCIVMLSGYPDEELKTQAALLGTDAYLIKPVTRNMLIPCIQAALASPAYAGVKSRRPESEQGAITF